MSNVGHVITDGGGVHQMSMSKKQRTKDGDKMSQGPNGGNEVRGSGVQVEKVNFQWNLSNFLFLGKTCAPLRNEVGHI